MKTSFSRCPGLLELEICFWKIGIYVGINIAFDFWQVCIKITFDFRCFSFHYKRWESYVDSTRAFWFLELNVCIWEINVKISFHFCNICIKIAFDFGTFYTKWWKSKMN